VSLIVRSSVHFVPLALVPDESTVLVQLPLVLLAVVGVVVLAGLLLEVPPVLLPDVLPAVLAVVPVLLVDLPEVLPVEAVVPVFVAELLLPQL
jgi:hypothetical protein